MSISRAVLAKYIIPGCIFVETGARWADTAIRAIELGAIHAESCEIDPTMADLAKRHANDATRNSGAICVHASDSFKFLFASSLEDHDPVVVFLDAHTDSHSPVREEISAICSWKILPRTILIDDLRCFSDWKINKDEICKDLTEMGYKLSFEDGVEPKDILVAQR